tara:strand:- start:1474 stop:2349 length:876 start_codon:yes stop_codon:yes gene_type:complete
VKLKEFKKLLRNEIINVLKENAVPDHDGKSAPFGSGYKKMSEANRYKDVSDRFKDILDKLPQKLFTSKNIAKLAKKEKRPDAAMAYAKDAYGWMMNENKLNELDDNEGQMAKAQLERSMEYSKMIYDFMIDFGGDSDKLQFPAWVQSKLTKSMDYLQSVYNYLDGKDGLADDPSALRKKQESHVYGHDDEDSELNEDVFKSFLRDDPAFKLYTAKNTDNRKSVMARKTDKTFDDGVPVLKFIARAPKKPAPLPKGSFKIIEDNKHGWWYYQVGSTWYGIRQKDYGTPPFEY